MQVKESYKTKVLSHILEQEKNTWIIPRDRDSFSLTHDFHPYFAAFPPQIPKKLIEEYSKKGEIVLDPFMGGGSTVVESFLLERLPYGSDISELSRLVSKVKVTPLRFEYQQIQDILNSINSDILQHKFDSYRNFNYSIPPVTNIDFWFSKESKYDLAILLHHINRIGYPNLQDFFKVGFSSIVRKVSYATNAQAHMHRRRGKKIPSVSKLFDDKILLMAKQMKEYVENLSQNHWSIKPLLLTLDVRQLSSRFEENSIDLIITSPPYGTGSRYTDIYRMSFEWLSLKKPIRSDTLETTNDFIKELAHGIEEMFKVLKSGKYCFIVYGDPSTGEITKTTIEEAQKIGFNYESYITCPIIKTKSNHHVKYRQFIPKDFILMFRKP